MGTAEDLGPIEPQDPPDIVGLGVLPSDDVPRVRTQVDTRRTIPVNARGENAVIVTRWRAHPWLCEVQPVAKSRRVLVFHFGNKWRWDAEIPPDRRTAAAVKSRNAIGHRHGASAAAPGTEIVEIVKKVKRGTSVTGILGRGIPVVHLDLFRCPPLNQGHLHPDDRQLSRSIPRLDPVIEWDKAIRIREPDVTAISPRL